MNPTHAVVELMGHRQRAGLLSEATIAGAPMLRVEHPDVPDLVEYYSSTALFSVRPCSKEAASAFAAGCWPARSAGELLPPVVDGFTDDLEDDDFDDLDVDDDLDVVVPPC
jgi:hypothetical protein